MLDQLPPPPPGKSGWPWTEASPPLPERMPDGAAWPRLSVVTPSYNQAHYLEETLRSVLLQGYPDLEYIVIDGGSSDGSVEILQKYAPWLSHWVSEKDRGQSHAINKGFRRASGQVMAYLNSDDIYLPGAAAHAIQNLFGGPEAELLIGCVDVIDDSQGEVREVMRVSPQVGPSIHLFPIFASGRVEQFFFTQPSMFWKRAIWEQTGELDEIYHYTMDRQWCLRALAGGARVRTDERTLARFTLHSGSKSKENSLEFILESAEMHLRFSRTPGFRRTACLLESLRFRARYLQSLSYLRSDQARAAGRPLQATWQRARAGALRQARRLIEALGQRQNRRARSALTGQRQAG